MHHGTPLPALPACPKAPAGSQPRGAYSALDFLAPTAAPVSRPLTATSTARRVLAISVVQAVWGAPTSRRSCPVTRLQGSPLLLSWSCTCAGAGGACPERHGWWWWWWWWGAATCVAGAPREGGMSRQAGRRAGRPPLWPTCHASRRSGPQ